MVARRLAVRRAWVRIPARYLNYREDSARLPLSCSAMRKSGEEPQCCWMYCMYERKLTNKKKKWHKATTPKLKKDKLQNFRDDIFRDNTLRSSGFQFLRWNWPNFEEILSLHSRTYTAHYTTILRYHTKLFTLYKYTDLAILRQTQDEHKKRKTAELISTN